MEILDNHLHITFKNDGSYFECDINLPIMINDVVVGIITDLDDEFVHGIIWNNHISRTIFADSGEVAEIVLGKSR